MGDSGYASRQFGHEGVMVDTLWNWLAGNLSPVARIWTAAAPALALVAYIVGGMAIFALRNRSGRFHDAEIEARASKLFGSWLRQYFAWLMRPILSLTLRSKLPPNAITMLSLLLASASGVALAAGRMALGGWLYVAAGACDFLDGRVARTTDQASPAGAMLDSVLDRYAEGVVFAGLAWFYRDSWILVAVLAALMGSTMVSYVKARGEALGVSFGNVGLMQRPERIVILGVTLALSPIIEAIVVPLDTRPIHRLAVIGILILAVSTQLTAIQRLSHARRQLSGDAAKRPTLTGRGSIFRTAVSSGMATGADFALFAVIVALGLVSAPVATLAGCALGAFVNFSINRVWAFRSESSYSKQAWRYLFVTTSSALLNSGLVAVLLLLPNMPPALAWWLVRVSVFSTWNYPLNRDYVFEHDAADSATTSAATRDADAHA